MAHASVDRFIAAIEVTAAGFLAAVTAITFVSVILRYLFAWQIPDSYDFSSYLLGILIFWGIAGASYRSEHITVDLVWGIAPSLARRAMTLFADLLTLGCLAIFTWMMGTKVVSTYHDNVQTFDLRLPVWIFYFIAWTGLAAAILLLAVRTGRMLLGRQAPAPTPHAPAVK
jgi:TRAP-type C4-dicarboxylate transport system permease small subunit